MIMTIGASITENGEAASNARNDESAALDRDGEGTRFSWVLD
jgi:hypothetical protein